MTAREEFAARLLASLKASGLTQAEVARRAHISGATLSLWLSGDADPSKIRATNVQAVAQVLDTTPEWLLTGAAGAVMESGTAYGTDTMGRIVSWSNPADLPAGRYVVLPRLAVFLSAGNGMTMDSEPAPHANGQAFRSDFIARMGWRVDTHYTMRVRGDSMAPTVPDGSAVVVDVSQQTIVSGAIYAVRLGTDVLLKRLLLLPNGTVRVSSDNQSPAYASFDVPQADVVIVGRAVHLSTLL
jgi:phage repressor protein C with HTH and peptisase S24 domain